MNEVVSIPSDKLEIRPPTTLGALFLAFLKISMYGFGGPIVWARRILIEERHWLSASEFAAILSFCQFLPGPNVVSITVCIGRNSKALPAQWLPLPVSFFCRGRWFCQHLRQVADSSRRGVRCCSF